jgi:nucleoside-diphosphate-sugar epimerase
MGPALITGGTGFLGRHLVDRLLVQGRAVTVLARRPAPDLAARGVRVITADLTDDAAVRSAFQGIETVFHVAAKVGVWGHYDDFYRANVLGTRAVLAGCRTHGVSRLVFTSTPSVVYNGCDMAGVDETLPLTSHCPAAYPLTKAIAEREVLAVNSPELRTLALRPHLIWGADDPHLVPRILAQARAGRLRIVGTGRNRVDMVHVENAVDAHLLAELALNKHQGPDARFQGAEPGGRCHLIDDKAGLPLAAGKAYFITNGEPVALWDWINDLLRALDISPVTKRLPLGAAIAIGAACETLWRLLPLSGEPPMTRFVAKELATDHWFDISAARRDLGYAPRVSMAEGTAELIACLRDTGAV